MISQLTYAVGEGRGGGEGKRTVAGLVVLVGLHGLVGRRAADQLMRPLCLMGAVGHLVVVLGLLGVVYGRCQVMSGSSCLGYSARQRESDVPLNQPMVNDC